MQHVQRRKIAIGIMPIAPTQLPECMNAPAEDEHLGFKGAKNNFHSNTGRGST
jgi:hypothetical protein